MSRFGFQQVQSSKITLIFGEDPHRMMNTDEANNQSIQRVTNLR